jgi:hypothetical protein
MPNAGAYEVGGESRKYLTSWIIQPPIRLPLLTPPVEMPNEVRRQNCGWILPTRSGRFTLDMVYEVAKLMLEHAGTFIARAEAIQVAISLGMPIHEIEDYLDWLDATKGPLRDSSEGETEPED